MAANLLGVLLAFCAVLVPLGVAWAVVEGPRWCALRRHGGARADGKSRS